MRTAKPISTISYNSVEYLERMLNQLIDANMVSFWCFVCHDGELLDNGKDQVKEKDHIHLFIEPHSQVDTLQLQKLSEEYDPDNPLHPLKCIYFRHSEWVDWLWYAMHDTDYLASKMEERHFAYTLDMFHYSDVDEFTERSNRALHDSHVFAEMKTKRMLETHTVNELAYMGMLKPSQASQMYYYEKMFRLGQKDRVQGERERLKQLAEDIALDSNVKHKSFVPDDEFYCKGTSYIDLPFKNFTDM